MNEISEAQYDLIEPYLPVRRGNARISNLTMINAVLHIAENGCKLRALLRGWRRPPTSVPMLGDRAYEGEETQQLVLDPGLKPVVPQKTNREEAWQYDRDLYKHHNGVERLFRRLKGFCRIFSRFEKIDIMFRAFLNFALIAKMLKY